MGRCEVCGNDYDMSFEVHAQGKVIGHGVQAGGPFMCCAQCAGAEGAAGLRDRV